MNPRTDLLAELADRLATQPPSTLSTLTVAVDAMDVHAETRNGRHTTEAFGRYCRVAVPQLLRRLLDTETEAATLRAQVARHIAAADLGQDPSPTDLLDACRRAGLDVTDDVDAARAVLEAETHAQAFS
ncbi:hypothetical protein ACFVY4_27020 [Streptomyces sp. NPDC058299]|uniref:hypothetical protein n=1 Tax=Streptomyces sp. NPDC058299 TaxID=3346435 RepID=UPI0036EC9C13